PHLAGAGAYDVVAEAADPNHLSGPHLPHRFGCDPHAAIPPGRRPRHRQGLASRPPQMDPARILQGVLRGRPHQHAVPAVMLPVHRAVARSRSSVPPRQGRDPLRRGRGLAGDSGLRHGASECAARLRHRSRRLSGFCLGHGHRPYRDAEIRHVGLAATIRERRALARSLRLQAARCPDACGRAELVSAVPEKYQGLRSFAFGDGPELADQLLDLVVKGIKTATCSTGDEPNTSTPGERWIVLDGRGRPACVIETTEVTYRRFGEVDTAFAYVEGEGDRSLAYWREAH